MHNEYMQNSTGASTSTAYPNIPDAILAVSTDPRHRATLVTCRECGKRVPAAETSTDRPLCQACYDVAGMENEHSDGYHAASQNGPLAGCPRCTEEAQARKEWEQRMADNPDGVPFTPEEEEYLSGGGVATLEAPATDADGYLLIDDDYNQDAPDGADGTESQEQPEVVLITGDTTDGTPADTAVPAKRKRSRKAKADSTPKTAPVARVKAPKAAKVVAPVDTAKATVVHPDGSVAWVYWGTPSMQLRCKVCGKAPKAHSVYPDPLPTPPAYTPGKRVPAAVAAPVTQLDPEPVNPDDAPIEGVIVTE